IFSSYGEQAFREAETEALRKLAGSKQTIVVTGGGIVLREENIEILKRVGIIVWLDGDDETLFGRASQKENRPLLRTKNPRETFSRILRARRPVYAKIANIRVDISVLTDEEVAVAILSKFRRLNPKPGVSIPATT